MYIKTTVSINKPKSVHEVLSNIKILFISLNSCFSPLFQESRIGLQTVWLNLPYII